MPSMKTQYGTFTVFGGCVVTLIAVTVTVMIGTVAAFGIPAILRYQYILNAQNAVLVNEIIIHQQEQLISVEQKKAQIRIEEAKGIADSQRIIDSSLTTNYLQYLAIQAQQRMADSRNHTTVYIPSGANGIPLVKTVE